MLHAVSNSLSKLLLSADAPAATLQIEESSSGTLIDKVTTEAVDIGLMVISAIAVWIVGGWIIKLVLKVTDRAMTGRHFDETLRHYLNASLGVLLKILLIVAILGVFGVETTSFAALFAAAGVAIGMAWSGLLSNFAAGIFMVFLKPIKVGDFVTAGGVTGTVKEIGLFVTVIDTMDNVKTIIGNAKIFGDNMQNYTANPYRRVELVAQLNHGVDYKEAIAVLRTELAKIPNVLTDPAPSVEILTFNLAGPVLCVRPFCHNDHYWDVYFATNATIKDAFGDAGFPVPETHYHITQGKAA